MTTINLDGKSLEELEAGKAAYDAKINELKAAQKGDAVATVRELVRRFNITAREIGLSSETAAIEPAGTTYAGIVKTRKPVEPKYVHPANPELTWSGRGIKPKFIAQLLADGVKLDDLLINK